MLNLIKKSEKCVFQSSTHPDPFHIAPCDFFEVLSNPIHNQFGL